MIENKFYSFPVRFDTTSDGSIVDLQSCNELESIDRHLELLLTTCPGEHRFNRRFGCRIWNMDFELVFSRQQWEDSFRSYIFEAVQMFEKRLTEIEVFLYISEVVRDNIVTQSAAIKKKVEVFINGKLLSNGEKCGFRYILYLGPLSTE
jgi:phage baseplate assembly protein W